MSIGLLTAYILIWPVISAGILLTLLVAIVRDIRNARENNRSMV